jgi:hypothetical protein
MATFFKFSQKSVTNLVCTTSSAINQSTVTNATQIRNRYRYSAALSLFFTPNTSVPLLIETEMSTIRAPGLFLPLKSTLVESKLLHASSYNLRDRQWLREHFSCSGKYNKEI